MPIVVSSPVPGLLGALEQAMGGAHDLVVVRTAAQLWPLLRTPSPPIDALILSDTLVPLPDQEVAQTLWELVAFLHLRRQPPIPVVLTLTTALPPAIHAALQAEVRKTGGAVYVITPQARAPQHPAIQQVVATISAHLPLAPPARPLVLLAVPAAGGAGTSTSLRNLCIYLRRRGLRVLLVDGERVPGTVGTSRPSAPALSDSPTRPAASPAAVTTDLVDLLQHSIVPHPAGVDGLGGGAGLVQTPQYLAGLSDALAQLAYDLICYDLPGVWTGHPDLVALAARPTTTPIVICPPGRKERLGACAALDLLGTIGRADGQTALTATMVLFVAGNRGLAVPIQAVRRDLLRQYPQVTDLGTLPHDPALISLVAEHAAGCAVFDLAPRRAYCVALRAAALRLLEAVRLPPSCLTQPDPVGRAGWFRRAAA